LPHPLRLHTLHLTLRSGAPASRPARIEVWSRHRHRVVDLDARGRADLPAWKVDRLRLRLDSTQPAFSDQGDRYVELGPGITELKLNGRSLTHSVFHTVVVPCGKGPRFQLGHTIFDTTVTANVRDLVRGSSVPLQVCAPAHVELPAHRLSLVAAPTQDLRVDSLTLTRAGATSPRSRALAVDRDQSGSPTSVQLPARKRERVLTLPQNINSGWQATLDGHTLKPQRVDGWKQGWLVPAGAAADVALRYAPSGTFRALLVAGAALLVVALLAAVPLRRRRRADLPPLVAGRSGLLDAVVVVGVAGLLTGWLGVAMAIVALVVARRTAGPAGLGGWGVLSAVFLLIAVVGLTWGPLKDLGWALYWCQVWAMAAVAALGASLLDGAGRLRRGPPEPAPTPAPSARS
jgi:arabinofuranan 3-O-arabinosyltransferase